MKKIKVWVGNGDESVVYNIEHGDMHLLSSFNAELLTLMINQVAQTQLIEKIAVVYGIEKQEAESHLNSLQVEYQKLNLID